MKRILILGREKTKFSNLAKALSTPSIPVDVASYDDLGFLIEDEQAKITICSTGLDLREYAQILVLSTSPHHARNYIFSATTCYCRKYGIKMIDDNFTNTDGKLYAMWKFWEDGINIPKTAFGPTEFLVETLPKFNHLAVLKAINGTKGQLNYLVRSDKEIRDVITANPEVDFILQNFIPNDGDYRIVLTNFEPKLAIYRSANGKDFRNNTSLGGEASLVPLEELDPNIINLAIAATKALNIKIAGADIIQDNITGEYSVLEVNRTPQLATGAFIEDKVAVLKDLIKD